MTHYHVMVDIETWGNGSNALPVSIGAVKFTQDRILDKFEIGIEPESGLQLGRVIDAGTIMWWFDPKQTEARERWLEMPKVDMWSAVSGFAGWCTLPIGLDSGADEVPLEGEALELGSLWGNGATFDNVILDNAAKAGRIDWPFNHRMNECFRTLRKRFPDVTHEFVGTPHVAVDDALNQALHLQKIAAAHGIVL